MAFPNLRRTIGSALLVVVCAGLCTRAVLAQPTFSAAAPIATGDDPRGVALGDADLDGLDDLAVAIRGGFGQIVYFRNSGGGVFSSPIVMQFDQAGARPTGVAFTQLDTDSRPDLLASVENGQLGLFFNSGGRSAFAQDPSNGVAVEGSIAATAAHFGNRSSFWRGLVSISNVAPTSVPTARSRIGDGNGGYPGIDWEDPLQGTGVAIAVGYFDGRADSYKDIAILRKNRVEPGGAVVLEGRIEIHKFVGDGVPPEGAFESPRGIYTEFLGNVETGPEPTAMVCADFNRDGMDDLAVACAGDGTLRLYYGVYGGNGAFTPGSILSIGEGPTALVAGDFDGDGMIDVAVSTAASSVNKTTLIGGLSGGALRGVALDVSGDGTVIVGRTEGGEAFEWTNAQGKVLLGTLPEQASSSATLVSDDGSVIVGTSGPRVFRRMGGAAIQDLGLPAGVAGAIPVGVSGDGRVVAINANGTSYVWREGLGFDEIALYLAELGVGLGGATIDFVAGMSNDGMRFAVSVSGGGGYVFVDGRPGGIGMLALPMRAVAIAGDGSAVLVEGGVWRPGVGYVAMNPAASCAGGNPLFGATNSLVTISGDGTRVAGQSSITCELVGSPPPIYTYTYPIVWSGVTGEVLDYQADCTVASMSRDGSVYVGSSGAYAASNHGTLADAVQNSSLVEMSDDGSTILGFSTGGSGTSAGVRWTAAGGIEPLVFPPGFVASPNFPLSRDGTTILSSMNGSFTPFVVDSVAYSNAQVARFRFGGGIELLDVATPAIGTYRQRASEDTSVLVYGRYDQPDSSAIAVEMRTVGTLPAGYYADGLQFSGKRTRIFQSSDLLADKRVYDWRPGSIGDWIVPPVAGLSASDWRYGALVKVKGESAVVATGHAYATTTGGNGGVYQALRPWIARPGEPTRFLFTDLPTGDPWLEFLNLPDYYGILPPFRVADCSEDGRVVFGVVQRHDGYCFQPPFYPDIDSYFAWRWTQEDGLEILGEASFIECSEDGRAAYLTLYRTNFNCTAVSQTRLWREGRGTVAVPVFLEELGIVPAGWTIREDLGFRLSVDGKTLAGTMRDGDGVTQGFVAKIPGLPSEDRVVIAKPGTVASSIDIGPGPTSLASGDVNGDGMPDLVAGFSGSDQARVLINTTPVDCDSPQWARGWMSPDPAYEDFGYPRPPARSAYAFALHEGTEYAYMFGGRNGNIQFDDLWMTNGYLFHPVSTSSPRPSARESATMVYDSVRNTLLLFGGWDGSLRSDLWAYNPESNQWTLLDAGTGQGGPPGRYEHVAAYDSVRGKMVVHGGWVGSVRADTWEWDSRTAVWTQVASDGATARYSHAAAFDPLRGRVVMHGGYADGVTKGDTWEWNGTLWSQVATGGPAPRFGHTMHYNWLKRAVEIFGGFSGAAMGDLWGWDGAHWTQRQSVGSPGMPAPRFDMCAAYFPTTASVFVFGGLGAMLPSPALGDSWVAFETSGDTQVSTQGPGFLYEGDRAVFTVSPGSWMNVWRGLLRYQWRHDRAAISDGPGVSGARTPVLSIDSIALGDSGRYDCVISTPCGAMLSLPTAQALIVGQCMQPTNVIVVGPTSPVCAGTTIVLTSSWDGYGGTQTFRWFKDGQLAYNQGSLSGVTTSSLTISGCTPGDSGVYSLRVTSSCGVALSAGKSVVVTPTGSITVTEPPQGASAEVGSQVTLHVGYAACGSASVRWYGPGGVALNEGPRITGSHTQTLSLSDLRMDDAGQYMARLTSSSSVVDVSALVSVQCARGTWGERQFVSLEGRFYPAMATDTDLKRTILFGGYRSDAPNTRGSGTWAFDGQEWTRLTVTGVEPSPRTEAVMTYDAVRHRLIMYGGFDAMGASNETWEFDGESWSLRSAERLYGGVHAMAFDPIRRVAVAATTTGNTYEWDGTSWQLKAFDPELSRQYAGMAFDPVSGRVLLFGGLIGVDDYRSDTRAWNGLGWTEIATGGPTPRFAAGLAFDARRGRVVLHGGWDATGLRSDTWMWNGSGWDQLSPSGPLPRVHTFSGRFVPDPTGVGVSVIGSTGIEGDLQTTVVSLTTSARQIGIGCEPAHATVGVGGEIMLSSCIEQASGPVTYQWRKDGVVIVDGLSSSGAVVSGATTTSLRVAPARPDDSGSYQFVGTDLCGSSYSSPAFIRVEEPGCVSHHADFITLGNLGGSPPQSYAGGISPDGNFATGFSNGPSGREAFVWSLTGGMVGLGDLPGGVSDCIAVSSSEYARTVVGLGFDATGKRAVIWSPGHPGPGAGADLPGGPVDASGRDVSGDGAIRVGQSSSALGLEAFYWTDAGIFPLADLAGGPTLSNANSISYDATTIVGYGNSGAGQLATRWVNGGPPISLGDLPGGLVRSAATGVSGDGLMIVGSSDTGAGVEAFYWTQAEGMVSIGDLPGGTVSAVATNVSASGEVIVGNATTNVGAEAFIWTRQLGMRSLADVLAEQGVMVPPGWRLVGASDVSRDGLTIAGHAIRDDGAPEGVVVRLRTLCGADFNRDGAVDFFDYDEFVGCFEGLECPHCQTADFDSDGAVDFFDYDMFVVTFENGC